MKGLIYKELFLGRKSYLSFLGIVAGLMLLGILVSALTVIQIIIMHMAISGNTPIKHKSQERL